MRSLAFKFTLAFLLVSLAGVVLVAVLSRQATLREFDQLLSDRARNNFVAEAAAYYRVFGTWQGVVEYFLRTEPQAQPPQQPLPQVLPPQPVTAFVLVDRDGYVVLPAGRYRIGERVPLVELEEGIVLDVDGQRVGTVLTLQKPPTLDPREEQYLARTNRALLIAGLGGTGLALLLGGLLTRTLTRPLRELIAATRALAGGDVAQNVPVRSQDELGELAAAFNQMSADLARANALRRQMTADIAHDLRTPLTVITGYLESLRDGVLEPSPERFDTMYNEARHLQRLVEDLRTLSLADAGELPLNRQRVVPKALLERLAAAYKHQAQRQDVALQVQAEPGLPQIEVDEERMVQVLGNLVSNALRYTPGGGQIALAARRRGASVQLAVQDDGAGIAPQALPHVFERFYRGEPSRQQQDQESGLGLAIVKSIVELHGGTIAVHSALGKGTTFVITLPGSHLPS